MPQPVPPAPDQKKRRPRWRRIVLRVLLALFLLAAAGFGYIYFEARAILGQFSAGRKNQVVQWARPELGVAPIRAVEPLSGLRGAETLLLLGSDKRAVEFGRGRSDTLMLVRVDPKRGQVSLLSIPRDMRVPIPGYGFNKINAAYSLGGVPLVIRTVREWLGIPIDHFFAVDFRGFSDLVSSLGGVYLPIDQRYYHINDGSFANNWASINIQPGYQRVGRTSALAWVRFRYLDDDLTRAARQQIFLREVGRELRARRTDVVSLPGLLKVLARATTSDLRSLSQAAGLMNTLRRIPPDRITRFTMPENGLTIGGGWYGTVSDQVKRSVVLRWLNPGQAIARQGHAKVVKRRRARPEQSSLVPNPAGRGLLARQARIARCAPTALPEGFYWPQKSAARSYSLAGHQAIAAYATSGSGKSVLWMWTTWDDPPILAQPSKFVVRAGRPTALYYESGRLRMVAWRIGRTRVWITNTLTNTLSDRQMLALADSCEAI